MKRKHYLPALFLLIAAITACKKNDSGPDKTGQDLTLTATELQKVAADNAFTLKLYKTVAANETSGQNLFLSPLSVSFALGMTSNGASGSTLSTMRNALNFNGYTQDMVNSYYAKLITGLPDIDPASTTLKIGNSIWYRNGFSVLPLFTQTNSTYYNAQIQALNFNSPAAAIQQINGWVSTQTNGKIPTIINAISPDDVMYLINAIYFKSAWKNKFEVSNTHKQAFYLANNSQVQADFMHATIDVNSYTGSDVQVIELPYANNKFSMVIALPLNGNTAAGLTAGLDSAKWQSWMTKLSPIHTIINLPKLKFSYNTGMVAALANLGMGVAFTDGADFSRINGTGGLKITDIKHKAYVEVNEDGTEAAAVTAVIIGTTAVLNTIINVDHPFIFAIREVKTGLILFTGTVNNPLLTGQ